MPWLGGFRSRLAASATARPGHPGCGSPAARERCGRPEHRATARPGAPDRGCQGWLAARPASTSVGRRRVPAPAPASRPATAARRQSGPGCSAAGTASASARRPARITSSYQTTGPSTTSARPVSSTTSRAAAAIRLSPSSTPPPTVNQNDGPCGASGSRPRISSRRSSRSSRTTRAVRREVWSPRRAICPPGARLLADEGGNSDWRCLDGGEEIPNQGSQLGKPVGLGGENHHRDGVIVQVLLEAEISDRR